MKHAETITPVAAALAALATLACCLPIGFAAAAATAGSCGSRDLLSPGHCRLAG